MTTIISQNFHLSRPILSLDTFLIQNDLPMCVILPFVGISRAAIPHFDTIMKYSVNQVIHNQIESCFFVWIWRLTLKRSIYLLQFVCGCMCVLCGCFTFSELDEKQRNNSKKIYISHLSVFEDDFVLSHRVGKYT